MEVKTIVLGASKVAVAASSTYAPYYTECPSDLQLVRQPAGVSQNESAWVQGRKKVVADAIGSYLDRLNLTDFDVQTYICKMRENTNSNVPVLAWATSGGGWRSALTGAGGLRAIDERTPGAVEAKVGGLYQSLTYLAGLSGGAWPTASSPFSEYASMDEQIANWHVNINRFGAEDYTEYAAPFTGYFEDLGYKLAAGFNVSVADFLGRGWAYEFVPGVNRTWSSIATLPGFQNFSGPLPMLQSSSLNTSSEVVDGLYYPSPTSPIYEWTPFEFGSWDFGFTPTEYVGTTPGVNGTLDKCVQNLDQASFVLSSAAAAYNSWWLLATTNGTLGQFSKRSSLGKRQSSFGLTGESSLEVLNQAFNETFGYSLSQIANPSIPNPFGGKENITFDDSSAALQAIPFWGLIQPSRKTDLILAWDDDADATPYLWNNGTNIYNTYKFAKAANLPFPEVPPVSTLLARNYTLKPTLFGCNSSLTTTGNSSSPIVAYFANSPYSWYSNYTWTVANMSYAELDGILVNSFDIVTQGNGTLSPDWTTCLGCAVIDRSLERVGMERTDQCEQCFAEFCWDGTTDDLPNDFVVVDPSLALDPGLDFATWNQTHPFDGDM